MIFLKYFNFNECLIFGYTIIICIFCFIKNNILGKKNIERLIQKTNFIKLVFLRRSKILFDINYICILLTFLKEIYLEKKIVVFTDNTSSLIVK